jgi:cell division protein FtsI (penicillin-binding protein 3)
MILLRQMRRNAIKLEGERSSALDLARGRLVLVSAFFVLAYGMLVIRAFDLTIIQGHIADSDDGQVQITQNDSATINARRADIVDRNGVLLATTLKISSLYADSKLIAEPQEAAKRLVQIFPDLAYGDSLQKLQSGKRYVWIKRRITPQQQYQVLEIGEPGLNFEHEYQRFYPQEGLAAHLVGYTNLDNKGLAGVERSFDRHLSEGKDLQLTLDVRLQHVLRREMQRAFDEFQAIGAAGVIMDIENGEILAGVSLPDFNPHLAGKAEDDQRFNRLTLGSYELGSVFKIFSTAAFFEAKDVPMSVTFDATQPIKAGRFMINDYHAENRILTAPEVFMHSSNIGSAMMAQAVGTQGIKDFYTDLGLLTPLDFEILEVARPLVPSPWREVSTMTASYGHGVTTTPMQLASGVSSIINGGYLVKPRLVMDDQQRAADAALEKVRIVSPETAQRMRQLLRLVVTEGTGAKAEAKGYRVGGKTGTAEKIVDGRYDRQKKMSSFVGAFPMDAPRYVVYIIVDEPQGHKGTWGYATGGWVAAPAISRVVASMASILGIAPARENSAEEQFGSSLKQYISVKEKR